MRADGLADLGDPVAVIPPLPLQIRDLPVDTVGAGLQKLRVARGAHVVKLGLDLLQRHVHALETFQQQRLLQLIAGIQAVTGLFIPRVRAQQADLVVIAQRFCRNPAEARHLAHAEQPLLHLAVPFRFVFFSINGAGGKSNAERCRIPQKAGNEFVQLHGLTFQQLECLK